MGKARTNPEPAEASRAERYRKLPERIPPEDWVTTQEAEPTPDPTMGRDPDRDFMLRNAGF